MNALFGSIPDFKKANGSPLYLSIAGHIEKLIKSGKLNHGQKLPTTADFAKLFNVTVPTAQQSLSTLMGKGLLRRSTRTGTFINVSPMSKNIAIVFGYNPLNHQSAYYRLLLGHFNEIATREGLNISCHFTLGGTSFDDQSRMLKEDAGNGRYACIIPIAANTELMAWLESQKNVPWVWLPEFDMRSMVHDGLSYLLKKGFRKIAFVSQCVAGNSERGNTAGMEYQGAWDAFAEKGLPMPEDMFKHWGEKIKDGHGRMKKLMADRKSRSDAIFINHDILTKGALKGLAELGLKIPDDIALITHANRGDEFESGIPLTKMEIDPYDVALATMHYVKTKFMYSQGKTDPMLLKVPDMIRPKLVVGKSCGEK